MTTTSWAAAAAVGSENSFAIQHPEGGPYTGEIVKAGVISKQGKNQSFWWDVKCLVGPYAGKKDRLFQTYAPDSPGSVGIWFRLMTALGIPVASFPDGTPGSTLAENAVGRRITYTVKHGEFENVKLVEGQAPVVTPVAPVTSIPAVPQPAAPVVEAPVAVAPVAAPAEDPVAALQAQIAALQAQQAAAAAAPAEAAPAPVAPAPAAAPSAMPF